MADLGHELTDGILANLEQDIADEYALAVRDMRKKLTEYLEQDEAKRLVQEKLLKAGEITQQEYNNWCFRHMMMGKRWEDMLNTLAQDMLKTNEIALKISRQKQPDVYALNANFATYQIEHDGKIDTGLSLYNHDAAEQLLEKQRKLMPGPSTKKAAEIAANKDMQWNYKKIQSAVLQGILQGESPYDVGKRLNTVGQMNYNAAVRYARTMTTNSQNAGRYQAFRRARDIGVDLTIEWQATLDGRTRHSHRMMHGQRRDVDEPFEVDGFKIMWPGNDRCDGATVPQEMIWNCRCTLLSWVKGFEGETVKSSPKMGDMSFEEWQNAKAIPDTAADRKQFKEYTKLLGKDAPKSYNDFQKVKYNSKPEWENLKEAARMERVIREAPCQLTKQKYSQFFLKPGAKHADDFFDVGYTQADVRRLRYDMARQFDITKATEFAKTGDGKERFNIYMELGVGETKRFCTGWTKDTADSVPRVITGFRKD